MAYTITNLINEYNSGKALKLANTAIKKNGLIAYATYIPANKGAAHTYTIYSTLPAGGITSWGDGVAATDVSGSTTTINLPHFQVSHQKDAVPVNNFPGGAGAYFNNVTPLYLNSLFQTIQKSWIYGTNATYGNSSYGATGLLQYVSASASTQLQELTGSAYTGSTMYAVRFSPFEQGDGAQVAVDVSGGVFYTNPDWDTQKVIAGSTGPFSGYQMLFNSLNVMVLPGTNNVAAISGINATTVAANLLTTDKVNAMLDAVNYDSNTIIICNKYTLRQLRQIGKEDHLQMMPSDMGYNDMILTWNGVPVIVDDNLNTTDTSALFD